MLRTIGGTITNFVAWFVIVTILNIALRHAWPAYAAVEKAMAFTLGMMVARLSESALSSLAAGMIAARIDRGGRAAPVGGIVLLLFFVPVHVRLFHVFPLWYHIVFLASLPLLGWAGGRAARRG